MFDPISERASSPAQLGAVLRSVFEQMPPEPSPRSPWGDCGSQAEGNPAPVAVNGQNWENGTFGIDFGDCQIQDAPRSV